LLGDDLYAHQAFCRQVLLPGFHFLFTCKPASHAFAAINRLWIRAEYASGGDASDLDVVTLWSQPSGPLQPVLAMNVQPEIWIEGAVGRTYRVEHQDDLEPTNVWLELAEVVLPISPFRFIDETALGVPRRFYRAILLP
jgi:hypothetical protein